MTETIGKAVRVRCGRTERKAARTAAFESMGGLDSIVPPVVEEAGSKRSSTGDRLRRAETAKAVYKRIAMQASDCCSDCGSRGVQSPEMVLAGEWPPVGSDCGSTGCGGVIERFADALVKAVARVAQEVRQ